MLSLPFDVDSFIDILQTRQPRKITGEYQTKIIELETK